MGQKTVDILSLDDAEQRVKNFGSFGGECWHIICKAWSETEGWFKSTKGMNVPGGALIQVTTQQQSANGTYAVAEALQFIPGVYVTNTFPARVEPITETITTGRKAKGNVVEMLKHNGIINGGAEPAPEEKK